MQRGASSVLLNQGLWRNGKQVRDAELRPVTGEDELALAQAPPAMPMASRTTELLGRTVVSIGAETQAADSGPKVDALCVGDRERLLLLLHMISFGDEAGFAAHCSDPACGEALEVSLKLSVLIQEPQPSPPEHSADLDGTIVRFRLPTGADQAAAAALAEVDLDAAAERMLDLCVVDRPRGHHRGLRALLAERLAELDPQAETTLKMACPACGGTTLLLVDAASLLFGRMANAERLMSEVDAIARSYHWSESEILALPTSRRRGYLRLIAEAGDHR